jgi:endogenous inhibitor of DNA gyrase (YacG/DUF329 family)
MTTKNTIPRRNDRNPEPEPAEPTSAARCPMCGRPRVEAFRPFCSKRCSDIDLSRWLHGVYAVPAAPDSDDESDETASLAPRGT